jgi:hypothetical protein
MGACEWKSAHVDVDADLSTDVRTGWHSMSKDMCVVRVCAVRCKRGYHQIMCESRASMQPSRPT